MDTFTITILMREEPSRDTYEQDVVLSRASASVAIAYATRKVQEFYGMDILAVLVNASEAVKEAARNAVR